MPIVSVIMAVYNAEQYLEEAITSVLNQTYTDFEFIIIDDGSTDTTQAILKKFGTEDSRVKIFFNEKNIGLTRSLNRALSRSQGFYIARMDGDDVSVSDRLEKQVGFLLKNQEVVALGTNVIKIDETGKEVKKVLLSNFDLTKRLKKRNCLVHGSMIYTHAALQTIQGYDERFGLAQDYDLILRLIQVGKIACLEDFLYRLRSTKNNLSTKKFIYQAYYTALAMHHDALNSKKNTLLLLNKLQFIYKFLYTFIVIYKLGIPSLLKNLNIIK